MEYIYIIQGRSAPDMVEEVRNGLAFLARNAAEFPGATHYEYFQSADDPTIFYFFSKWQSEADFQHYATSAVHEEYKRMLPEGAWAEGPKRTTLQLL
jgi:quinol monooxygenase YgiN